MTHNSLPKPPQQASESLQSEISETISDCQLHDVQDERLEQHNSQQKTYIQHIIITHAVTQLTLNLQINLNILEIHVAY